MGNSIGFEGWDHRAGSFLTSWAIGVLCLLLLIGTCLKSNSSTAGLRGFLINVGVAGTVLGIAHKLLDDIYDNGQVVGTDWKSPHCEWMYFWAGAMISTCFAQSALVQCALQPVASGKSDCNQAVSGLLIGVTYIGGLGMAIYSVYIFAAENRIDDAQQAIVIWGLASSAVAIAVNVVCFFGLGGEGCCHCQRILMAVGGAFMLLGWALIAFSPEVCRKGGEARDGCPWPEEFNQNIIFHLAICLCVIFVSCAVFTQSDAKYTKVTQEIEAPYSTQVKTEEATSEPTFIESLFRCCQRTGGRAPSGAKAPLAYNH